VQGSYQIAKSGRWLPVKLAQWGTSVSPRKARVCKPLGRNAGLPAIGSHKRNPTGTFTIVVRRGVRTEGKLRFIWFSGPQAKILTPGAGCQKTTGRQTQFKKRSQEISRAGGSAFLGSRSHERETLKSGFKSKTRDAFAFVRSNPTPGRASHSIGRGGKYRVAESNGEFTEEVRGIPRRYFVRDPRRVFSGLEILRTYFSLSRG